MQATVEGRLAVYFYDTLAGEIKIGSDTIKALSMPHVLRMALDASNVGPVPRTGLWFTLLMHSPRLHKLVVINCM